MCPVGSSTATAGGRGFLLRGDGLFKQVNGFLCHRAAMARGDLPQLGVQGFGKGFDDKRWHGEERVAFRIPGASVVLAEWPNASQEQ